MREHLIQKSLVETYLLANNIEYNVSLFRVEGIPVDGLMYVERGILRMLCPGITNQQILDMEVSVKASQAADFTPTSIDFDSIANVDTVVVADLVRDKKVYKGLIFTDPSTGLEVDLQEYSGEDANAIAPNVAPTPPNITVDRLGSGSVDVSFTGAADSDGTIFGYNMYIDGSFHSSTTQNAATLNGLEAETEYELSVHSVDNDLLQSTAATFKTFSTIGFNTIPKAPTNMFTTLVGLTTATLTFTGGVDSEAPLYGYRVYDTSTNSILGTSEGAADITVVNLSGLQSSTTYSISVYSVDQEQELSLAGLIGSFTTQQAP